MTSRRRVAVLGIPVDCITEEEAIDNVARIINARLASQLVTVNPEFLVAAQQNMQFRHALQSAELSLADGIGVRLAATFCSWPTPNWQPARLIISLFQGVWAGIALLIHRKTIAQPIPATITGTDFLIRLAAEATKQGWSLYLAGGGPGVADQAARALVSQFPELIIVGAEEGIPKDRTGSLASYEAALIDRIRHAKPDILAIAFGAPKQDVFIATHKASLGVPIMIGVGGAFDFYAHATRRAPVLMRTIGLEWFWRLVTEPWRWNRILTAVIRFPLAVLRGKLQTH